MAAAAHAFMQTYTAPGLSIAVGHAGTLIYQDAFGVADRERNEPLTPMHLFRIANVTKPITSTTIFSLIEQGRLRLDDRVFGPGALLGTDFGAPPYRPYVADITLGRRIWCSSPCMWTDFPRRPTSSSPRRSAP
jgi:CubicO group peptidase (beta-lactamase class C family)